MKNLTKRNLLHTTFKMMRLSHVHGRMYQDGHYTEYYRKSGVSLAWRMAAESLRQELGARLISASAYSKRGHSSR
jgi:hypothetical protein